LIKLTNEVIGQAKEEYEERLGVIEGQLADLRGRLHKLYDALETGKLDVEDLAPRIKELKAQMDKLEEKRLDLMEAIRDVKGELLEAQGNRISRGCSHGCMMYACVCVSTSYTR
jgi:chromosome segregation ATPase